MKKIIIITTIISTLASNLFSMEKNEQELDFPILAKLNFYQEPFFKVWEVINLTGKDKMEKILSLKSLNQDGLDKVLYTEKYIEKNQEKVRELNKYDLYTRINDLNPENVMYDVIEAVDSIHKNYDSYLKGTEEIKKFIKENNLPISVLRKAVETEEARRYRIIGKLLITQMNKKSFLFCWSNAKSIQDKSIILLYLKSAIAELIERLRLRDVPVKRETIARLINELNLFVISNSSQLSDWVKFRINDYIQSISKTLELTT